MSDCFGLIYNGLGNLLFERVLPRFAKAVVRLLAFGHLVDPNLTKPLKRGGRAVIHRCYMRSAFISS
jgi:hypothetical protein